MIPHILPPPDDRVGLDPPVERRARLDARVVADHRPRRDRRPAAKSCVVADHAAESHVAVDRAVDHDVGLAALDRHVRTDRGVLADHTVADDCAVADGRVRKHHRVRDHGVRPDLDVVAERRPRQDRRPGPDAHVRAERDRPDDGRRVVDRRGLVAFGRSPIQHPAVDRKHVPVIRDVEPEAVEADRAERVTVVPEHRRDRQLPLGVGRPEVVEDRLAQPVHAGVDVVRPDRVDGGFLLDRRDRPAVEFDDAVVFGIPVPRHRHHRPAGLFALLDHRGDGAGFDDPVAVHRDEVVVDVRFRLQERVARPELRLLDGVLDVDVPVVAVAEVTLDALALVPHHEDELVDSGGLPGLQDVFQEWPVPDREHRLRPRPGQRPEPRSLAGRENHCLHTTSVVIRGFQTKYRGGFLAPPWAGLEPALALTLLVNATLLNTWCLTSTTVERSSLVLASAVTRMSNCSPTQSRSGSTAATSQVPSRGTLATPSPTYDNLPNTKSSKKPS